MIRSLRCAAVALAAMAAATAASAATFNYEFKTFYDTSTILNPFDTKTLDYSVAKLAISDVAGGVQLKLTFNDTAFPAARGGLSLDELWLAGPNGALQRSSGAALQDSDYYKYGFLTENGKYNWDIDFKDGAFVEGSTAILNLIGGGVTLEALTSGNAPMIELSGVGKPYSGLFGLNSNVRFVGSPIPVPEPSTYALMGLGLVGIALASRKKRQG